MLRLDPRVRLCIALEAVIAILLTRRVVPLCILLVCAVVAVVALHAVGKWGRAVRLLAPMLVLLTLFSAFGSTTKEAIMPALKLLALSTVSTALFAAVPVDELADTFVLLRLPTPVSFMLIGGIRYAPMMARQWTDLLDARRARGAEIPRGVRALPAYASLLVPVVVRTLRTADEMAEAMESRGFGGARVTLDRAYRLRAWDWLCMATSLLVLLGAVIWLR